MAYDLNTLKKVYAYKENIEFNLSFEFIYIPKR